MRCMSSSCILSAVFDVDRGWVMWSPGQMLLSVGVLSGARAL